MLSLELKNNKINGVNLATCFNWNKIKKSELQAAVPPQSNLIRPSA